MILEISMALSNPALRILGVTVVGTSWFDLVIISDSEICFLYTSTCKPDGFWQLIQPCSLECFLGLSECQLSYKGPLSRIFGKKNNGGSGPEISEEGSNASLKDGKPKGDGQANAVSVLSDQKTSWQGLCFP